MHRKHAGKVLEEAAINVRTQDNLATADPIFMVQEKRETYNDISGEETASYWHSLQPFFTEKAAQKYIDANKHNLSSPRIFVESGYGNYEWQMIRLLLKDGI